MQIVLLASWPSYNISNMAGDSLDVAKRQHNFNGQVNNMLCFFRKLSSIVKSCLFGSYCTSFYGCELWDLSCDQIMHYCTAWRKGLHRVWDLPYQTHCYLLPLLSHCLPVFDEICSRLMNFVFTCLSHTSKLIRYVAHHCIRFGLNFSPFGRNILFCARRYGFDVDDVFFNKFSYFPDVIYSCVSSKFTSAQNCTADLLFESDGRAVLSAWFLSSDVSDIISCCALISDCVHLLCAIVCVPVVQFI